MTKFFHKHGKILAYLFLAAAVAYAINNVHDQSLRGDRRSQENRQAIIVAGKNAVEIGCKFDLETNTSLRKVIRNSQIRIEALYRSDSLTLDQVRVYRKANITALEQIPIPDCATRASNFVATTRNK